MSRQGRVYKRDDGTWAFDVEVNPPGAKRNRRRGRGFGTKGAAREAMETDRARFLDVRNPSRLTFGRYLIEWVDDQEVTGKIREGTAYGYRNKFRLVDEWFADVRLDRVTATDLDRFYRYLLTTGGLDGNGRSARTVHQIHRMAKTALKSAVRKGLLGRNPADFADPPKPSEAPQEKLSVWEPEEVIAFLGAPWLPDYRRIIWETAFGTGFRRSELAGLYWSDVDNEGITVRRARVSGRGGRPYEAPPKSRSGNRTVPIHEHLSRRLHEWRAIQAEQLFEAGFGPQYMFTNPRLGPWRPDSLSAAWSRDAHRAVIEGLVSQQTNLHNVRHWYGDNLFAVGTDLSTIKGQMGHSSATFTANVYGRYDQKRAKAAAEAVGGLIFDQ